MIMKLGVKALSEKSSALRQLAGDARELLGLEREEVPRADWYAQEKEKQVKELAAKIARAPVDVRGPLAEVLRLPYKASPEDIAREVPKIEKIAQEMAATNAAKPRSQICGEGLILTPDMATASEE